MTVYRNLHKWLPRGHVYDMGPYGEGTRNCAVKWVHPCQRKQPSMKRFNGLLVQRPAMYNHRSKGPQIMYSGKQFDFIISKTLTKSEQHGLSRSFSTASESTEDKGILVFSHGNIFQKWHIWLRGFDKTCLIHPDLIKHMLTRSFQIACVCFWGLSTLVTKDRKYVPKIWPG